MNYTELIAALSLEMRLDLAGGGSHTIRFDDAVDVTIEAQLDAQEWPESTAGDVAHLHAMLTPPVGAERERLFATLLQLHVFGVATDDAYFGFDAVEERVTLSKSQPLRGLDTTQAVRAVASFVDQCHRWNAALPSLAASE